MDVGFPELLIILLIALLLFGGKRIPEISKNLGESVRGFKDAFSDGKKKSDAQVAREVGETARDIRKGVQQARSLGKTKEVS
jgi:sec-independent protein translocase protein TatA